MAPAPGDLKQNTQNKAMEQAVVKTVAAFLNTEGGTLLIGVDDSGTVLGVANDYKTLGKHQERDGFESWLTKLRLDQFGKETGIFERSGSARCVYTVSGRRAIRSTGHGHGRPATRRSS